MTDVNGNSEARIGSGSEFHLANYLGVLIELDEVIGMTLPEEMADDVDVTHYKSASKEYKRGMIDPGEGTLELNYIPDAITDLLLRDALRDGKTRAFKAIIPSGVENWEITGFLIVKSRSRAIPIGDRMTLSVGVRFTGSSTEDRAA